MLGTSQTFVGVLITLIVLCLFHDKTNFFTTFLSHLRTEISQMFEHTLNSIVTDINSKFWKEGEKEEIDYQFFFSVAKETPILQQQLYQVTQDAQMIPSKFMEDGSVVIEGMNNRFMKIEGAKEFGFSSLYLFFFGVVVLFIDSVFTSLGLFGSVFVYTFVLSSYAFLSIIWIQFWSCYKPDYRCDNLPERPRKGFIILNKFLFIIIPLLILVCFTLFLKNDDWIIGVISYLGLGIGYFLIYFYFQRKHFKAIRNMHKYNRRFIICHFVWIFLASLSIGLLYCILNHILQHGYNIDINSKFYTDFHFYMEFTVLFIVLNGILIPFLLAYIKYYLIKNEIEKTFTDLEKQSKSTIDQLKANYNHTISEIKKTKTTQPTSSP